MIQIMKKFLLINLIVSAISCTEHQNSETLLSAVYVIDTINSIHNAGVAEIDSVFYIVPDYKNMNFHNKDSVLKLHNVIRYFNYIDCDYFQSYRTKYYLNKLAYLNDEIPQEYIFKYDSTINDIKLYSFSVTPENFLLILQTIKRNYIFYVEKSGYVSDVYENDGFVKEYVPILMPLFSKKDLAKIRKAQGWIVD